MGYYVFANCAQCETPTLQPLSHEAGDDDHLYMECSHCNVIAVSRTNWEGNPHYSTLLAGYNVYSFLWNFIFLRAVDHHLSYGITQC